MLLFGIQTYTLIIMKDMKHTILIVTGLETQQRRIGRTIGYSILKVPKSDSKGLGQPF
jgi:hypothetical protein